MVEVVSRDAELASLHAFIGDVERGPAALVLEGEAGIGKSTLWLAGIEAARARGFCVLSSRPAEAERDLACRPGRSLRRRPGRVAARPCAPTAPRARGRAAARGALGGARRSPRTRRCGARSPATAERTRPDAARGRRRPVARLVLSERALVRAATTRSKPRAPARRSQVVRGRAALGDRAGVRAGPCPPCGARAVERRGGPQGPARPARHAVSASDIAADPRAVGRQPVLRARARSCPRRRRRSAGRASRARDARRARPRADLRPPCRDPRGSGARLGTRHRLGGWVERRGGSWARSAGASAQRV